MESAGAAGERSNGKLIRANGQNGEPHGPAHDALAVRRRPMARHKFFLDIGKPRAGDFAPGDDDEIERASSVFRARASVALTKYFADAALGPVARHRTADSSRRNDA